MTTSSDLAIYPGNRSPLPAAVRQQTLVAYNRYQEMTGTVIHIKDNMINFVGTWYDDFIRSIICDWKYKMIHTYFDIYSIWCVRVYTSVTILIFRIRIRIRNRLFSECTGNTLIIWSHTSMQNNEEDPITIQWRGSLRLFAHAHTHTHTHTHIYIYIYIYIYTYTHIHILTYIYIYIYIHITPPPNPGDPESREIRRVCWSYRPEIWQATRQSCCRDARPISQRLEKI